MCLLSDVWLECKITTCINHHIVTMPWNGSLEQHSPLEEFLAGCLDTMALPKFISCSTNGGIYRGCVHNATLESGNCEAIANKCREGAIARCFLLQHKCRICIGSSTGFEYSRVSCPEALDTCDGADREISNGRGSSFQTGYPLCGHCCLRYLYVCTRIFLLTVTYVCPRIMLPVTFS